MTAPKPLASESGKRGVFLLARTGDTADALVVRYSLSGKTRNGIDYLLLSGKAIFPAGSASRAVRLVPINDTILEKSEPVVMTLRASPDYLVGVPGGATVTIKDND